LRAAVKNGASAATLEKPAPCGTMNIRLCADRPGQEFESRASGRCLCRKFGTKKSRRCYGLLGQCCRVHRRAGFAKNVFEPAACGACRAPAAQTAAIAADFRRAKTEDGGDLRHRSAYAEHAVALAKLCAEPAPRSSTSPAPRRRPGTRPQRRRRRRFIYGRDVTRLVSSCAICGVTRWTTEYLCANCLVSLPLEGRDQGWGSSVNAAS